MRSPILLHTILYGSLLLGASALHAVDFEYVKIAQSDEFFPGIGRSFGAAEDFDLEGSEIVFQTSQGIFNMSSGGSIGAVATRETLVPGGNGVFIDFSNPSISNGAVAFRGISNTSSGSFTAGIYVTRNGNLTRVADLSTSIPGGTGAFTSLLFSSVQPGSTATDNRGVGSGLSFGNVVFRGDGEDNQRGAFLATRDGTFTRLTDAAGNSTATGLPAIEGDSVVYRGAAASIYRYSLTTGMVTTVLAPETPLPNGDMVSTMEAPTVSGGYVAFGAVAPSSPTRKRAVYVVMPDGSLRLVADGSTPVPGGNGTFRTDSAGIAPGGVTISGSEVAFSGRSTSGIGGIYTTLGGELEKLIDTSDTIFGLPVTGLGAAPKISGGNILFNVVTGDSKTSLVLAMSKHHWSATGGAWDVASNWAFGVAPRGTIPTFLDPANGAVITGPATNTTLKSLTIGAAQTGVAELNLQASGQVSVEETLTITPRGRLNVAGTVSALGGILNEGVIAGAGQIGGRLSNGDTASVRVAAGQRMLFTGANNNNAGAIEVTGGELEFSGQLINQPSTGAITARDATLRFGSLTNPGTLALVAGTTDVHGDINNTGSIVVGGGTGSGTRTAIFHDDVVQNGTLSVSATGSVRSAAVFLGGFSGAGGIAGGGDVFFEGDIRPGNSPAPVTYAANVSLSSTSQMTLELAGRAQGTQYDYVTVTGAFTLGGVLEIALLDNFDPEPGDRFDLFNFDPLKTTGAFSEIRLPPLGAGEAWDVSQLTSTGEVAVIPEPASTSLVILGLALFGGFRFSNRRLP